MSEKVTWNDLYKFIQQKIEQDPKFLENELMIEVADPSQFNKKSGWSTEKDAENWLYVKPALKHGVLTTTFKNKKIVTLNINY